MILSIWGSFKEMKIATEKLFPSGDIILTAYYKGQFYKKRYAAYGLAEAKKLFKQYVKEQTSLFFY